MTVETAPTTLPSVATPVVDRAALFAIAFAGVSLTTLFGGMLWAFG